MQDSIMPHSMRNNLKSKALLATVGYYWQMFTPLKLKFDIPYQHSVEDQMSNIDL